MHQSEQNAYLRAELGGFVARLIAITHKDARVGDVRQVPIIDFPPPHERLDHKVESVAFFDRFAPNGTVL